MSRYSSEFSLKKEKCLSCAHYSGCHGFKSGFISDRIQYESKGYCDRTGKETSATRLCSKYQREASIAMAIANKERKENERKQIGEQRRQRDLVRRQKERQRLE